MFDWITGLMGSAGHFGVFALMFGENVFPPIPSEVVMPLAGFLAAQGTLSLLLVILAGTAGSVLGAMFWYYVGVWIGADRIRAFAARHGRWLTISASEVDAATGWFRRYGWRAVFFGRMIPGVRTFVSVPAGVARMRLVPFLAFTALGSLLWTGLLALAGFLLESQYDRVQAWINPVSTIVIALAVGWYVFRLVRGRGTSEMGSEKDRGES